jgi:hypothetical protein
MSATTDVPFKTGDILEISGARVRVDHVFGATATHVQLFGTYVDVKNRPLPGRGRRGSFANWVKIAACRRVGA